MLKIITIGGITGIVFWLIFSALGITWLGYLLATIITSLIGWSLKTPSTTSLDYLMDLVGIFCCLGIWLILIYSYEIEWAKALFLSSLFILAGGMINLFGLNQKNE